MTPADVANLIQPAIDSGQCLLVTYQHKSSPRAATTRKKRKSRSPDHSPSTGGQITTHTVVPYAVAPGARSTTGEPMFWSFCLDHQRIEQRIPANVISIEPAAGDFGSAPLWSTNA